MGRYDVRGGQGKGGLIQSLVVGHTAVAEQKKNTKRTSMLENISYLLLLMILVRHFCSLHQTTLGAVDDAFELIIVNLSAK